MKTVAMIPVRMGSTRVPKKNIRMLAGKPLVAWIIEAAKAAGCFDEIYLNSEDDLFREIANEYGIKFYKRPFEMAADSASNDDFMYDFLKNVECDRVIQLLATSPFISGKRISAFVDTMDIVSHCDTLISVKRIQIECIYPGKPYTPINFDPKAHTQPSQDLVPVFAYACGIMGWSSSIFKRDYENNQGAYHGMDNIESLRYFELEGYETVDIDNEQDFILAEAVAAAIVKEPTVPKYYEPGYIQPGELDRTERDVNSILALDGVKDIDLTAGNVQCQNIFELIKFCKQMSDGRSWSRRIVNTPTGSATLICQKYQEGNREHYHPDIAEWWWIVEGAYRFLIDGKEVIAMAGSVVFVDRNQVHQITAIGVNDNIRLAVSVDGARHVYTDKKQENA